MNITDRATAAQISAAFTALGIKPPAAFTASHQRTVKLSEGVRAMSTRAEDVVPAVADALEQGIDPAQSAEVQRILTAGQIQNSGIMQGVDGVAYGRHRDVCLEHADAIVGAWRKPFDTAAAALGNAHQRIGDLDLDDTTSILAIGGNISETWAAAQTAVSAIRTIANGWAGLATFTGQPPGNRHRLLRIADIDPGAYIAQQLDDHPADPWAAARNGHRLSLPTLGQYQQRIAAIDAARQQIQANAEQDNTYAMTGRRPPTRTTVA